MAENQFSGGVWPVMLTPFTEEGQVDYPALERLIEWYIDNGVSGLFANNPAGSPGPPLNNPHFTGGAGGGSPRF